MELSTIIGLLLALIGLLGGMMFKGVPFSALANEAAIFIILVGTSGAVANAFPTEDLKSIPNLFRLIFTRDKSKISSLEAVQKIVEIANVVRKDGIISMESRLDMITDPFMLRGMEMLLIGHPAERIEDALLTDIENMESRHAGRALIFSQAGAYAPTLGVLGAVIGLIAAMSHMDDVDALGHAISAAFMATVYGIFTGYVLWHPFANKLKRKSKAEALTNRIITVGLMNIAQGERVNVTEEEMLSYLSHTEREKYTSARDRNNER